MRVYRFAKLQRCLTFATSRIIGLWQRAYDSDEMAGLIPYRVVRHETMTKEKISPSTPQPCDEAARTRQELLDELNDLRLENAYLKKSMPYFKLKRSQRKINRANRD